MLVLFSLYYTVKATVVKRLKTCDVVSSIPYALPASRRKAVTINLWARPFTQSEMLFCSQRLSRMIRIVVALAHLHLRLYRCSFMWNHQNYKILVAQRATKKQWLGILKKQHTSNEKSTIQIKFNADFVESHESESYPIKVNQFLFMPQLNVWIILVLCRCTCHHVHHNFRQRQRNRATFSHSTCSINAV